MLIHILLLPVEITHIRGPGCRISYYVPARGRPIFQYLCHTSKVKWNYSLPTPWGNKGVQLYNSTHSYLRQWTQ